MRKKIKLSILIFNHDGYDIKCTMNMKRSTSSEVAASDETCTVVNNTSVFQIKKLLWKVKEIEANEFCSLF